MQCPRSANVATPTTTTWSVAGTRDASLKAARAGSSTQHLYVWVLVMSDPIWYEKARTAALGVLTNGEPTSGEIVDAMMPFFAEVWDEAAERFDPDFFWHDGGRAMNPYAPERSDAEP